MIDHISGNPVLHGAKRECLTRGPYSSLRKDWCIEALTPVFLVRIDEQLLTAVLICLLFAALGVPGSLPA